MPRSASSWSPKGCRASTWIRVLAGTGRSTAWGASWMTREDRDNEIADYVAYLDRLAGEVAATAAPAVRRRVVLGFSQGAHTASRWVVLGRTNVHELLLWGAGLATDLSPDALAAGLEGVRVTFVRGARDKFRDQPEEEAQDAMLRELGVPFSVLIHPGGHEIAHAPLSRISASSGPPGEPCLGA